MFACDVDCCVFACDVNCCVGGGGGGGVMFACDVDCCVFACDVNCCVGGGGGGVFSCDEFFINSHNGFVPPRCLNLVRLNVFCFLRVFLRMSLYTDTFIVLVCTEYKSNIYRIILSKFSIDNEKKPHGKTDFTNQ